jgi:tRNA A37 threonylcarbamoyltransferase TsaD
LVIKLTKAIEKYPEVKGLFVGGGVFNSEEILRKVGQVARKNGFKYVYPEKEFRGDNAGMVGIAAYYAILNKKVLETPSKILSIDREPRLSL